MAKVERAIINAAGFGSRLLPYTKNCPKPLLEVEGKRIIQSILDALRQNGIYEIYVVVGYLKEKFSVLEGVGFIENPVYDSANNIASIYAARAHLQNCLIIDGDQIIRDPSVLKREYTSSGYFAAYTEEETKEWLLNCDDELRVLSCQREGGRGAYQLYGISYWQQDDGKRLAALLEKVYKEEKKTHLYWDDVALFCYPEEFALRVYPMTKESVLEIDSKEEYECLLAAVSTK